jgi:predicted alpha/beta-hydrolase family hydrolase
MHHHGAVRSLQVNTPRGPAEVQITDPAGPPVSMLVLGHGASGGVHAPDLARGAPAPAPQLDEAWTAVVREIADPGLPLICGGRSSGARVACRTAAELGAAGVLCLAFPLHPPGKPDRSRAAELPTAVPTLVVNGDRDPFGVPDPTATVEVVVRPGATHDLRKDLSGTATAVLTWLNLNGWAR